MRNVLVGRLFYVAEAFEARRRLGGMREQWWCGGECTALLQVGCDPLGVRVKSGGTGEDAFFEEVIYRGHLESFIFVFLSSSSILVTNSSEFVFKKYLQWGEVCSSETVQIISVAALRSNLLSTCRFNHQKLSLLQFFGYCL